MKGFCITLLLLLMTITLMSSKSIRCNFNPVEIKILPSEKTSPLVWWRKANTKEKRPRSRPLLFERALGFTDKFARAPDKNNWTALKNSGLFANLSSHMTYHNCPYQRKLTIFGKELPSLRFSPELSVGSSLSNPDIEGRMRVVDKNFGGLGQFIDFCASWKTNPFDIGNKTGITWPRIDLTWKDTTLGRKGFLSSGISAQEYAGVPPSLDAHMSEYTPAGTRSFSKLSPRRAIQSRLWLKSHRTYDISGATVNADAEAYMTKTLPVSMKALFGIDAACSGLKMLVDISKKGFRGAWSYDAGVTTIATGASRIGRRQQRHSPYHMLDVGLTALVLKSSQADELPVKKQSAESSSKAHAVWSAPWNSCDEDDVVCWRYIYWGDGIHAIEKLDGAERTSLVKGSTPAGITGSVKLNAHLTGLSPYVRPGAFIQSSVTGANNYKDLDEAMTANSLNVRNKWGFFVKAFNGLRADISWNVGEDVNKFRLSLDTEDEVCVWNE